jgi:hypothetical protein
VFKFRQNARQENEEMSKDWQTRWDETINYLNSKFLCPGLTDRLGAHIEKIVPAGQRKAISEELSIGYRRDGKDDPTYAATTSKRQALRGLFLCQRVYYSDIWAKRSNFAGTAVAPASMLTPNWRNESMQYWGGKGEQDIVAGIQMFAPTPGATASDLQKAAYAGAPNGKAALPGNLKLSRTDTECVGAAETCYNGITAWLLRSGLASMRWFMQDSAPNNQFCCDRLFGTGEEVWRGPFKPDSPVPDIPAGFIVHIWSPENYNWNGHWVVTNGDGTICGVNNGEMKDLNPPVLKKYTNHGTLRDQFEDGYGGKLRDEPPLWKTAVMVKIDPTGIPNLM